MITEADAVIIGAGAFGVSAAFHLAKGGLKRVVIVDRFAPGSQSSRRAAGLFKNIQGDLTRTRLTQLSIRKMLDFEAETGLPSLATCSGSLLVARAPEYAKSVEREVNAAREWGVMLEMIDAPEARRLMPTIETDGIVAICHIPSDIYIEEPISLIEAYLKAGARLGVQVLSPATVTGIAVEGGEVEAVITDKGRIETRTVVDAAGAWARMVGDMAGARVPVVPMRHQLYITQPITGVDPLHPIVRFIDTASYLRPARGGLMLGGFELDPMLVDPRARPASFSVDDVPLDGAVVDKHVDVIAKNVPIAKGVAIQEHRGGLFTMTADGRFIVGPTPELRGFWLITGCNGSGFSFSPALGQTLAEWITEGKPSIDLSTLAPRRYATVPLDEEQLLSNCIWQYGHYYDPVE
jgi:glycine/D-amino acid oxidase-like deaminating enzyme